MTYGKMMPEGRRCGAGKLSHEFARVSAQKPVGYETLSFLEQCKLDPAALEKELRGRGLKTLMLTGAACTMRSGALYAYDEAALQKFLEDRVEILSAQSWPVTAEGFIRRIAIDWALEKTPLFDLIADAFNNKSHPGRCDVPVPDSDSGWDPAYLAHLRAQDAKRNAGSPRP